MNFLDLAKERYSCRSFEEKEIEKEKIEKILEAARVAPTAVNYQPQRILILNDKEKLSRLSECTKMGWNAPLIMIICYDKTVSWKSKFDGRDEGAYRCIYCNDSNDVRSSGLRTGLYMDRIF